MDPTNGACNQANFRAGKVLGIGFDLRDLCAGIDGAFG